MATIQRIHPSPDPEAAHPAAPSPPSAPLIPPSTTRSDKPDLRPPPTFAPPTFPPQQREGGRWAPYSKPRRRCRLCRCLCCTLCLLLLVLILLVGVFAAVLFLGFHPKLPSYSIDGIRATQFTVSPSNTLSAAFSVNLTAVNPNTKLGIYYTGGSHLSVWFSGTQLCQGSLPVFYQGHRNTTHLQVPLSGQVADATGVAAKVQAAQSAEGGLALEMRGKVPVRVKMGKLKLMKIRFKATCKVFVDSLSSGTDIGIKSSSCKIRLNQIFGITF